MNIMIMDTEKIYDIGFVITNGEIIDKKQIVIENNFNDDYIISKANRSKKMKQYNKIAESDIVYVKDEFGALTIINDYIDKYNVKALLGHNVNEEKRQLMNMYKSCSQHIVNPLDKFSDDTIINTVWFGKLLFPNSNSYSVESINKLILGDSYKEEHTGMADSIDTARFVNPFIKKFPKLFRNSTIENMKKLLKDTNDYITLMDFLQRGRRIEKPSDYNQYMESGTAIGNLRTLTNMGYIDAKKYAKYNKDQTRAKNDGTRYTSNLKTREMMNLLSELSKVSSTIKLNNIEKPVKERKLFSQDPEEKRLRSKYDGVTYNEENVIRLLTEKPCSIAEIGKYFNKNNYRVTIMPFIKELEKEGVIAVNEENRYYPTNKKREAVKETNPEIVKLQEQLKQIRKENAEKAEIERLQRQINNELGIKEERKEIEELRVDRMVNGRCNNCNSIIGLKESRCRACNGIVVQRYAKQTKVINKPDGKVINLILLIIFFWPAAIWYGATRDWSRANNKIVETAVSGTRYNGKFHLALVFGSGMIFMLIGILLGVDESNTFLNIFTGVVSLTLFGYPSYIAYTKNKFIGAILLVIVLLFTVTGMTGGFDEEYDSPSYQEEVQEISNHNPIQSEIDNLLEEKGMLLDEADAVFSQFNTVINQYRNVVKSMEEINVNTLDSKGKELYYDYIDLVTRAEEIDAEVIELNKKIN